MQIRNNIVMGNVKSQVNQVVSIFIDLCCFLFHLQFKSLECVEDSLKSSIHAKLCHLNKYDEFINMTQKTKYLLILRMLKHQMMIAKYLYLKQSLLQQKEKSFICIL